MHSLAFRIPQGHPKGHAEQPKAHRSHRKCALPSPLDTIQWSVAPLVVPWLRLWGPFRTPFADCFLHVPGGSIANYFPDEQRGPSLLCCVVFVFCFVCYSLRRFAPRGKSLCPSWPSIPCPPPTQGTHTASAWAGLPTPAPSTPSLSFCPVLLPCLFPACPSLASLATLATLQLPPPTPTHPHTHTHNPHTQPTNPPPHHSLDTATPPPPPFPPPLTHPHPPTTTHHTQPTNSFPQPHHSLSHGT